MDIDTGPIPAARWYAAFGGAPVAHRAARAPAAPKLSLEWHVGGVRVHPRPYRTITAALLAKPAGAVLMFRSGGVLLPWTRGGV